MNQQLGILESAQLTVGIVLGAAIWAASEFVTGEVEPWDSGSGYYWLSVFGATFLKSLICRRTVLLAGFGIYLGQVIYMEVFYNPPTAHIFPSFLAVAIFSALPAICGVWVAAKFGDRIASSKNRVQ